MILVDFGKILEYYSGIMNDDSIPFDPDRIQSQVANLCALVYEGLIIGTDKARETFEHWGHSLNLTVAANITRYLTKMHLITKFGLRAPYLLEEVPANGVSIRQGPYRLRVLKGKNGNPPVANKSERSQRFFSQSLPGQISQQMLLPNIKWDDLPWLVSTLNLIICWEVDSSYCISRVQLLCPQTSGNYRQGIQVFWRRNIPHPVLGLPSTPTVNDEDRPEDLDIFFDDAEDQGL